MLLLTTKERLLCFLAHYKIKKLDFYKTTGIKRGFLDTDKLKGSVSDIFLTIIVAKYSNLNLYWLLTGEGIMLCEENFNLAVDVVTKIPLLENHQIVSCNKKKEGILLQKDKNYHVITEFEGLNIDFLLRVSGASMYPKYNNGDLVACKKIPLNSFFQWNRVYVLYTSQEIIVKRLKKGVTKKVVLCVSDNPDFDDFELPLTEVKGIAIVEALIHKE